MIPISSGRREPKPVISIAPIRTFLQKQDSILLNATATQDLNGTASLSNVLLTVQPPSTLQKQRPLLTLATAIQVLNGNWMN